MWSRTRLITLAVSNMGAETEPFTPNSYSSFLRISASKKPNPRFAIKTISLADEGYTDVLLLMCVCVCV